jgi:beta-fructofuranosidase
MAPDEWYDGFGCFSGSAVETEDGRQLLVYTGVRKEEDENGNISEIQTQCVAVGDGTDYVKYGSNPVIVGDDLPEGAGKFDFRDPKVFKENGRYYMVVGNKTVDKDGQILQFISDDGFHWKYDKIVKEVRSAFFTKWYLEA